MKKLIVYVEGGIVQWTAGSPDIEVIVVDRDNQNSEEEFSVSIGKPNVSVPDDHDWDGYVDSDISQAISDYESECPESRDDQFEITNEE